MCTCNCPPTRGEIINRRAATGAEVVALRARIPELEKQARKTPPKTLVAERAKVEAAKEALMVARARLAVLEVQWDHLKDLEAAAS